MKKKKSSDIITSLLLASGLIINAALAAEQDPTKDNSVSSFGAGTRVGTDLSSPTTVTPALP
ncbi:MAG: hypothetical protein HQK50_08505, partial [Oligoflexia bacterium]|nr:hypothetical protein [Oligoflexia bacterium]